MLMRGDSGDCIEVVTKTVFKLWDIFGGEEKYYTDLYDKKLTKEKVTQKLKSLGYDGVVDESYGQIAVFNPTQIKSINNQGTFDPKNPNILKGLGLGALGLGATQQEKPSTTDFLKSLGL
jgi:hypothetical protein